MAERKAMRDGDHALSISRQAQLAGLSRDSVYSVPTPVSAADLVLMCHLDALHLSTRLRACVCCGTSSTVRGSDRAYTRGSLMARMRMEALYR